MIKKTKSARETGELETEGKNSEKPPFGQIFGSHFDLPNHYSNNVVVTDSDFKTHETSNNCGCKL